MTGIKATKVFISFIEEDKAIATALDDTLRRAFSDHLQIDLCDDLFGDLTHLDRMIDEATFLIWICASHNSTNAGYIVGRFLSSIDPTVWPEKFFIPFTVLKSFPTFARQWSGVDLKYNDLEAEGTFDVPVQQANRTSIRSPAWTKAILRLLRTLDERLSNTDHQGGTPRNEPRIEVLQQLAGELSARLIDVIGERIKRTSTPETLLIQLQPAARSSSNGLETAIVRTRGYCSDSFGIEGEDREFEWKHFVERAAHPEIKRAWQNAFRSLLMSGFLGSEIIPSFDGSKQFRLVVTRKVSLFNGVEEHVIYLMPERQSRSELPKLEPSQISSAGSEKTQEQVTSRDDKPDDQVPITDGRVRVFISYKHADRRIVDEVRNHLGWLENAKHVKIFDDSEVPAGKEWNAIILNELRRADIIVFLISAEFMRSPYCTQTELNETIELRSNKNIDIIPIILETCDWVAMPLRIFAALPKDENNNLKPLNKWHGDRDVALTQIAKQIRQLVEGRAQA